MRLEKASTKAVNYACKMFHYAKSVPVNTTGFSVFNDKNEWCGVVLFGSGANNNLASGIGLNQGQALELVRMALNGKHGTTSKVMAMSLKLIKKQLPLCKLLISFADPEQGHKGTIYQATNWFYIGTSKPQREVIDPSTGKVIHKRIANGKYGTIKGLEKSKLMFKHKYIYPLDKSLIPMCKALSKPYPKKEITCDNSITANAAGFQLAEEGQHHLIAQKD